MPPLSFTQSKYALVIPVIHVKSMPGTLVAMPPSLIGSPVAFWPVPMPHSPGFWMLLPCPPLLGVEPPVSAVVPPVAGVVDAAVVVGAAVVAAELLLLSEPHDTRKNNPAAPRR